MIEQEILLNDLLEEKSYLLIILDACRFDDFEQVNNLIEGDLKKVRTNATHTYSWHQRNLRRDLRDVKLFGGHPIHNRRGIVPEDFIKSTDKSKWRATDFFDPKNIYEIWRGKLTELEHFFAPIPTQIITEKIIEKRLLGSKNIIWLMTPHAPYLSEEAPTPTKEKIANLGGTGRWEKVNYSKFSVKKIREFYREDIERALSGLQPLIRTFEKRKVISSDHGELFSPNGLPLHGPQYSGEEIEAVPWLEID